MGVEQTIPVGLGDEVSITAYGKYLNLTSAPNATQLITGLASAFGVSAASTGEALRAYNALGGFAASVPDGSHDDDDDTAPKAFVTILFFDKDYNLVDAAWDQMSTQGLQSGSSKTPHDVLSVTARAPQAGYAYIYVSNEHPTDVEVHFDDVTVTHTPSVIIVENEYYPFGLSTESYTSDKVASQSYRYNGKELQDELGLDWYDYGARMYMADIGRWGAVDPLAELSRRWSPYTYVYDNPIRFIDPDGMYGSDAMVQMDREWGMRQLVYLSPDADATKYLGTQVAPAVNMNSREEVPSGQKASDLPGNKPDPDASRIDFACEPQQRDPVIVHVTEEIVGYTTVKSYKHRSSDEGGVILFKVPLYKVVVTGQDDSGTRVMKTFQAVRFGVQRNSTGGPFMVGITEGAYNLSASDYLGGSFHVDGGMPNDGAYIHKGNANLTSSTNSFVGCVGISGPGSWGLFSKTMTQLGFGTVGATTIFHAAPVPSLVDSGLRWNP